MEIIIKNSGKEKSVTECSWIPEDNIETLKIGELMQIKVYKSCRNFKKTSLDINKLIF